MLAIVCIISLTLPVAPGAQEKKVYNWRIHGAFAPGDASFDALYPFAEELKKRTNDA